MVSRTNKELVHAVSFATLIFLSVIEKKTGVFKYLLHLQTVLTYKNNGKSVMKNWTYRHIHHWRQLGQKWKEWRSIVTSGNAYDGADGATNHHWRQWRSPLAPLMVAIIFAI